MTNPYAVTSSAANERGVFGDHAQRIRTGFLFRVIDFGEPFAGTLVYDAWWFRQRILINGHTVWFRISWKTILPEAEFRVPAAVDPRQPPARIEIGFTRGLFIQRFRFWLENNLVYDEIN